jgi:protein-disulfide isomerase
MILRKRSFGMFIAPAILAALVASCGSPAVLNPGPATELAMRQSGLEETDPDRNLDPARDNDDGGSDVRTNGAVPGVVGVASTSSRLSVQPGSSEVNQAGIPVGFTTDGHAYLGDPAAPVVIQEYSDFQCPFCARFVDQTLPMLIENQIRTGEVVLVYYDFPLTNIHPQALAAANAARCAGELGAVAYWLMHDRLFADLSAWSDESAGHVFERFAEDMGLDAEDFSACQGELRYREAIQADLATGTNLGVTGTPSFFLNGQSFVGAQPLAAFNQAIETVRNGGRLASAIADAPSPNPSVAPTPAAISLEGYAGAMGDPDAPVTIVEYTDYQCPYCSRHSQETMPVIVKELVETGRVFYLLKDFPLDRLHPSARVAAAAARCAGEQGAYWEMHDDIYARQSDWADAGDRARAILSEMAGGLGLDGTALRACIDSGRFDGAVQANLEEGMALGVTGTPSFFVNGYPLSGARPYEHFELATSLAEAGRLAEIYSPSPAEQPRQEQPSSPREVDTSDALAIGDPDAPVTIVEFTDFQCPFCSRHFQQTFPRIQADYVDTGLARYVFKDFPLDSIHPQAAKAAEAARCAGDQDAYLEMHHLLFERQQEWSNREPMATFEGYAEDLGIESVPFSQCLRGGVYAAAVEADLQQGIALGVTGTPAFFLNGQLLSGAQPYAVFQQALDSLLAQEGD